MNEKSKGREKKKKRSSHLFIGPYPKFSTGESPKEANSNLHKNALNHDQNFGQLTSK